MKALTARDRLVVAVRDAHQQGPMLFGTCAECADRDLAPGARCSDDEHRRNDWGCMCGWLQDAPHAEHVADMIGRALFAYDQQDEPRRVELLPDESIRFYRAPRDRFVFADVDLDDRSWWPVEDLDGLLLGDPMAAPGFLDVLATLPPPPGWSEMAARRANLPAPTPNRPGLLARLLDRARREIVEARMIARWIRTLPHRQHNRQDSTDDQ